MNSLKIQALSQEEQYAAKVQSDIRKIDDILKNDDYDRCLALHEELDGKYQSWIPQWGMNMHGYSSRSGFDYEDTFFEFEIKDNLCMMKSRLKAFLSCGVTRIGTLYRFRPTEPMREEEPSEFQQVREQVEDMASLTDEETKETLNKISEIEAVIHSKAKKKAKWEKLKPVLSWLTDENYDIGMAILPLMLNL